MIKAKSVSSSQVRPLGHKRTLGDFGAAGAAQLCWAPAPSLDRIGISVTMFGGYEKMNYCNFYNSFFGGAFKIG